MPDLVELCHVLRSRARAAIAKVCEFVSLPLKQRFIQGNSAPELHFLLGARSRSIRDRSLVTATCGLMTGPLPVWSILITYRNCLFLCMTACLQYICLAVLEYHVFAGTIFYSNNNNRITAVYLNSYYIPLLIHHYLSILSLV